MYYVICVWFGFGTGYWAMFVTLSAEQFGTNIRSTATTTIPNFVRGTVILMTILFNYFKSINVSVLNSAFIVGGIVFLLCLIALFTSEETHGKDLDFIE
jgi:Flp pilus assembly protein protease CpaA